MISASAKHSFTLGYGYGVIFPRRLNESSLGICNTFFLSHNGKLLNRNVTQASNRSHLDFLEAKPKKLNQIKTPPKTLNYFPKYAAKNLYNLGEKKPHVPKWDCYCTFKNYSKGKLHGGITPSLHHSWKLVKITGELLVWKYQEYYEHRALTSRGLVSGTVEIINGQSHRALLCKQCQEILKSVGFVSECQNIDYSSAISMR